MCNGKVELSLETLYLSIPEMDSQGSTQESAASGGDRSTSPVGGLQESLCLRMEVVPTSPDYPLPAFLWTRESIEAVTTVTAAPQLGRILPTTLGTAYLMTETADEAISPGDLRLAGLRLERISHWWSVPVSVRISIVSRVQGLNAATLARSMPAPRGLQDALDESDSESALESALESAPEDLVGTAPRPSTLAELTPPPSSSGRSAPRTQTRSRRRPNDPSQAAILAAAAALQQQQPRRGRGKPDIPVFSGDSGVSFQMWRCDVERFRASHGDADVRPHVYRSLEGRPGRLARSYPADISLDTLLDNLSNYYGERVEASWSTLEAQLTSIRQQNGETVTNFAARVEELAYTIR